VLCLTTTLGFCEYACGQPYPLSHFLCHHVCLYVSFSFVNLQLICYILFIMPKLDCSILCYCSSSSCSIFCAAILVAVTLAAVNAQAGFKATPIAQFRLVYDGESIPRNGWICMPLCLSVAQMPGNPNDPLSGRERHKRSPGSHANCRAHIHRR